MTSYEVIHAFEDGRKIAIVPLSNSKLKAKLLETDFNELMKIGAVLPWRLVQGTVYVRNKSHLISIARLIIDADKGQQVSLLDGDPCNLLRSNLVRIAGNSRYRARDMIDHQFKHNVPNIIHRQRYEREGLNMK
ncbi:MAG: hypothetical protein ACHQ1H_06485 [Nitrososphaerales archaeon]